MSLVEYLVSVVVLSAMLGFINFLAYPSFSEKSTKFATAVLLLYAALSPLLSFLSDFDTGDVEDFFQNIYEQEIQTGEEYAKVAENAFKEGISKLLCTKYGVNAEEMNIFVYGFDFEKMDCERIKILLFGRSVTSDLRGIESYITELGLGECEVDIIIG